VNQTSATAVQAEVITAASSRKAATYMDIGNVIAVLLPFPLGLLWLGLSLLVFFSHRRHPNAKVSHYTRQAAYRFYGAVVGALLVAALFPGEGWNPWYIAWAVAALAIIPWSLWSLARIRRDRWEDVHLPVEETPDV